MQHCTAPGTVAVAVVLRIDISPSEPSGDQDGLLRPPCPAVPLAETPGMPASAAAALLHPLQVATHAAVELGADKLLVITGEDVRALSLPHYLPLVRALGWGWGPGCRGQGGVPGCLAGAVLGPCCCCVQCGMPRQPQLSLHCVRCVAGCRTMRRK